MEPLSILVAFGVVILSGMLGYILSPLLKLPEILLLLMIGTFFSVVLYHGAPLLVFPSQAIVAVSVIAITLVVLDGTLPVRTSLIDTPTIRSLKCVGWCTLFVFSTLPILSSYALGISFIGALILTTIIFGTASETTQWAYVRAREKLKIFAMSESIYGTLIALIVPFLVIDIARSLYSLDSLGTKNILGFIGAPLSTIVIAVGSGILVGAILLRFIKQFKNTTNAPVLISLGGVLVYALSEYSGSGGVRFRTDLGQGRTSDVV